MIQKNRRYYPLSREYDPYRGTYPPASFFWEDHFRDALRWDRKYTDHVFS